MEKISSRSNPKVKLARSLRQRKDREESGLFLVEGVFHVGAALEAKAEFEYVISAPELLNSPFAKELTQRLETAEIECYSTSSDLLESLTEKENPQGLVAVIRQKKQPLSTLSLATESLLVAVVAPQDPGNLGSILRTIDAAGAAGLVLLDGGVDPYHPSAVRAGMGAHFWKPIVQSSFAEFIDWTQKQRAHIYGSSAHAQLDYRKAQYQRPGVLLLGSEREGLSAEQVATCEQVVSLPMRGMVTSLNLSVAAGILMYAMAEKSTP